MEWDSTGQHGTDAFLLSSDFVSDFRLLPSWDRWDSIFRLPATLFYNTPQGL
jgi:hypothetical protein